MKVFIIDIDERYEHNLYFVEYAGFTLDAMQALLDLKYGPGKPPPREGSSEWNSYSSGLHVIVGTGDVEVFDVPEGKRSNAPIELRDLLQGLENSASGWLAPEYREAGRQLVLRLPQQFQSLLPDLLIQGSSIVVGPVGT